MHVLATLCYFAVGADNIAFPCFVHSVVCIASNFYGNYNFVSILLLAGRLRAEKPLGGLTLNATHTKERRLKKTQDSRKVLQHYINLSTVCVGKQRKKRVLFYATSLAMLPPPLTEVCLPCQVRPLPPQHKTITPSPEVFVSVPP